MGRPSWPRFLALVGVAALLLPGAVSLAQEARSIADILSGKTVPLSMKPADIPADFKPVRLKVAGSGGGGLLDMMGGMMMPFMMMGASSGANADGAALMSLLDMSWTKGDVVKVQGKDFIVTYKWSPDMSQSAAPGASGEGQGDQSKAALKAMELSLTLVAVEGLTSISPVSGFTKDDLLKLIEKASKPATGEPTTVPPEEAAAATVPDQAPSSGDISAAVRNVKQVALGTLIYLSDYDDVYPYAQSTKAVQYVTYPYVKTMEIWKTQNPAGSDFRFNMALGGSNVSAVSSPAETVLFYESAPWADGRRAVAFVDGHAKAVSAEEWVKCEKSLRLKLPKSGKPLPLNYGLNWNPGK